MRSRLERAFTLVELVIVIAIVGILAAIAIPRFIDIRDEAYRAARDGIVGGVRAGIMLTASRNQTLAPSLQASTTFPPNLETTWASTGMTGGTDCAVPPCDCNSTNPCFELVVPGGVDETDWDQVATVVPAEARYEHVNPIGPTTTTYEYEQNTGTFTTP